MSFTGETYHTDKAGNRLPKSEVLRLARANIRASVSTNELIDVYIDNLEIYEIIEWAADEEGNFPIKEDIP